MFVEESHNRIHYEWIRGRWIVCQQEFNWMPYTSKDIADIDCEMCLAMYPCLFKFPNGNPGYDLMEFGRERQEDKHMAEEDLEEYGD